jgi:hypothetical protein
MKNFLNFLSEENKPSKNDIKDVASLPLHHNNEGVAAAAETFKRLHDHLLGKESSTQFHVDRPSSHEVVFGNHPSNKQFFVSSPNGNPNFSHEDIEANHGGTETEGVMKHAIDNLSKILPRKGGVFHGKVLHNKDSVTSKNGFHNTTPGQITYSAHKDSKEGKKMKNSNIGIIIHSHEKNGEIIPVDKRTRETFNDHPDVNNIDPNIKANSSNYSAAKQKEFLTHYGLATSKYKSMKPESLDIINGHEKSIEKHLDDMAKTNLQANADTYIDHLTNKYSRKSDNARDNITKDNSNQNYSKKAQQVFDNKDHFAKAIDLHQHLNSAKHSLMDIVSLNEPFIHSKRGIPTEPQTIVAIDKNGQMTKMGRNKPNTTSMNEEIVSGGEIRGLGFNTGNPAADENHIANYVDNNTADLDQRNNILKTLMKKSYGDLHTKIGFKSFNPKQKINK